MQSAKLEVAALTYGRRPGVSPDQLAQQYMPLVRKIAREHDVVRGLHAGDGRSDFTRVRYAMVLSVPGMSMI